MRLSVIIPTVGRPCLARAVESVTTQLLPGDELIVKHDATGDWAATPRTEAMWQAVGDYLLFLDDDDVYQPGALRIVRAALAENPDRVHIFRVWLREHQRTIWIEPEVKESNVTTQGIVVPNKPDQLGRWGTRYEGDYDFLVSTLERHSEPPVWHPEVIATWRA
jgi:glycosyltransferase involved in cell wall biosynthesis